MQKKKDDGTLIGSLLFMVAVIGIWVAAAYGYVWNIITLLRDADVTSTTELVVRILGVVLPPAGAIMGYF